MLKDILSMNDLHAGFEYIQRGQPCSMVQVSSYLLPVMRSNWSDDINVNQIQEVSMRMDLSDARKTSAQSEI